MTEIRAEVMIRKAQYETNLLNDLNQVKQENACESIITALKSTGIFLLCVCFCLCVLQLGNC